MDTAQVYVWLQIQQATGLCGSAQTSAHLLGIRGRPEVKGQLFTGSKGGVFGQAGQYFRKLQGL